MKASELRIGNIVHFTGSTPGGKFDEIMPLSEHEMFCDTFDPDKCAAVPLTEEWLVKFGFRITMGECTYGNGKIGLFFDKTDGFCECMTAKPKHVHQLQNLYFALTGEELTVSRSAT